MERAEAEALLDAAREGQRAYDLAVGPLVRWRLYRLDGTRHLLWVGMHHIVTDGWSLTIMCRELAELYEAAVTQRQPALSPLGLQYADFAVWQRSWLSGAVLQKQLDYWRGQLAMELPDWNFRRTGLLYWSLVFVELAREFSSVTRLSQGSSGWPVRKAPPSS